MSGPPIDEQRIAAYVRGELGETMRAEVEAALDADPQWLAVVALLARGEGATTGGGEGGPAMGGVPAPGTRVGRYVVGEPLGRGATGVVCAAWDPELRRDVALKLVDPSLLTDPERAQARLSREAKALARVEDPHVVRVFDVGTWRGRVFVAMERLDGGTLDDWRRAASRSWRAVLERWIDAGVGLAAAHAQGLVHRDFKPANAMLDGKGRVVVVDFGLARRIATSPTADLPESDLPESDLPESDLPESDHASIAGEAAAFRDLTRTGASVGTPAYMPPEQHRGGEVTAAADQYAFCVSLHEALEGRLPDGILRARIPPLSDRPPRRIWTLLATGHADDPADRHPDMASLLAALRALTSARRGRRAALAVLLLVVLGGLVAITRPDPPCSSLWGPSLPVEVVDELGARPEAFAPAAAARVHEGIEAFSSDWRAAKRDACEGHRAGELDDGQLDRRVACLDAIARRAAGTLAALRDPSPRAVLAAPELASSLGDPASCTAPTDESTDEPTRRAASEIRDDLARVQTDRLLGRFGPAMADARELVARADELGLPELRSTARLQLGVGYEMSGELDHAAAAWREAADIAMAAGLAKDATRALVRAAYLVGSTQGDVEEGRTLVEHAAAWSARAGSDPALEADRLRALGHIELVAGRLDEATSAFRAAEKQVHAIAADDLLREPLEITVLNDLGVAALSAGDIEGAEARLGEAARRLAARVGDAHPQVAQIRNNLAALARASGRLAEARALFERNLEVFEAANGEANPSVLATHANLSVLCAELGDIDAALEHGDRAVALAERIHGVDSIGVAKPLADRGQALYEAERYRDALVDFYRARRLFVTDLGESHAEVGMLDSNIAGALTELGELEPALEASLHARATLGAAWGDDDPRLAVVLLGEGVVRHRLGQREAAVAVLRRAVQIGDAATQDDARAELAELGEPPGG